MDTGETTLAMLVVVVVVVVVVVLCVWVCDKHVELACEGLWSPREKNDGGGSMVEEGG